MQGSPGFLGGGGISIFRIASDGQQGRKTGWTRSGTRLDIKSRVAILGRVACSWFASRELGLTANEVGVRCELRRQRLTDPVGPSCREPAAAQTILLLPYQAPGPVHGRLHAPCSARCLLAVRSDPSLHMAFAILQGSSVAFADVVTRVSNRIPGSTQ